MTKKQLLKKSLDVLRDEQSLLKAVLADDKRILRGIDEEIKELQRDRAECVRDLSKDEMMLSLIKEVIQEKKGRKNANS